MKPKIGIPVVDRDGNHMFKNYITTIEEYGGEAHLLIRGCGNAKDFVSQIDGLLLPGGGDIHPDYFNQEWHPEIINVNEDRDELEISIFEEAFNQDIPVFGICRGIQVMSVAMGGSLYQDIETEYPQEAVTHPSISAKDSRHNIEIEPESVLGKIIGESAEEVNSAHHQAVDDIGEGFVVTARSEDGIVEAMENPSKQFMVGVQYHPERMTQNEKFREHRRKLFEAFLSSIK
ncbi:MAG: gamma-glutamyl-gamma-aminobutyrate hydrolase family protein [Candidatus Poribacteria bacterium]|nr:gamma-glutamyl-gamma-aminobutyrate hydrolase family protein [Candidatus Poribacteria bacterium]